VLGSSKPAGYINRFVETWAFTWETRSTMFLAGDIDLCAVPRQYRDVVLNKPGIRCIYPLPTLTLDAIHFTYDIVSTTPYGPILAADTFDENGIPSNFFGNAAWGIHARKAFAYSFDYNTYIAEAWLGEATHIYSAIIPGLLGYNSSVKGFEYNLAQSIAEFKLFPGLWDTGFTITLLYNTDNIPRQRSCELIKSAVEGMNSKFHVNIVSVSWSTYLYAALVYGQCPIWDIGWQVDYPDPHDFAYPYYASTGDFNVGYNNPAMDALIDEALRAKTDAERIALYSRISELGIADCPSFTLQQGLGRHFERDWICGWYWNMAYPDNYMYNLWKWYYQPQAGFDAVGTPPTYPGNYVPVDVNYDGKVNIVDITVVAQAFGSSYGPPIGPRWSFRGDVDSNRIVNIVDIAAVAKYFTKTSAVWTPSA